MVPYICGRGSGAMEGAAARDAGVISSYVGELKQLRN